MSVISVTNQKGGVGKTTTTINLASALAEKGREVLIIDLDPQGNATTSLGFDRRDQFISTYEVLMEGMSARSAIFPTVQNRLWLFPANENLPGAEIELVDREDRSYLLKRALEGLTTKYDYILIDCPPSLGILTVNALTASDGVLIPMQAEFLALEGLSQLLKTFDIVRGRLNPSLEIIGVLFTMYDGRTRLSREVEHEVREFFSGRTEVFESVIPRTIRLAEAPSHGLPITLYASKSGSAEAFRNLATEVINATETRTGKGPECPYTAGRGRGDRRFGETGDSAGGEMDPGDTDRDDHAESPPAPPLV